MAAESAAAAGINAGKTAPAAVAAEGAVRGEIDVAERDVGELADKQRAAKMRLSPIRKLPNERV